MRHRTERCTERQIEMEPDCDAGSPRGKPAGMGWPMAARHQSARRGEPSGSDEFFDARADALRHGVVVGAQDDAGVAIL